MESHDGIVWTDSSEELENSKDSELADSENDQVDNDVDNDVDADIDEDDQWGHIVCKELTLFVTSLTTSYVEV